MTDNQKTTVSSAQSIYVKTNTLVDSHVHAQTHSHVVKIDIPHSNKAQTNTRPESKNKHIIQIQ